MNPRYQLLPQTPQDADRSALETAMKVAQRTGHFALIYVEGSGAPVKFHYFEETLQVEVERLARQNPGKNVFVLRPTERAIVEQAPVTIVSLGSEN